MRGTQGAMIVASTLQIVLGFSGLWRNVLRFVQCLFPRIFCTLKLTERRENSASKYKFSSFFSLNSDF
jgi:hypothetical protein